MSRLPLRGMANPQYLQGQLGSVVNAYQLQNWTPLAPGAYQFAAANWQVSQTVQDQMADLEKQRQTLEQKRDSLLQSLQSATTRSDVQKYSAALTGVNRRVGRGGGEGKRAGAEEPAPAAAAGSLPRVQRQQMTEMTGGQLRSGR